MTGRALKCVMVTNYFPGAHGGIAVSANTIASGLAIRGIQFEWFASGDPGPHDSFAQGITPRPVSALNTIQTMTGAPVPLWSPRGYLELNHAIHRSDVVFIHDCLYASSIAAWILAKWHRRPVLLIQHIAEIPFNLAPLRWFVRVCYRTIGRAMLEGSDRVIFPADNIKKYFMSKFPGLRKGKLIRHGIDTKVFRIPDEPVLNDLAIRPRMLFVGRFIHRKGLDIMRNLARDFPECDWVFAGEGVDDPSRWGLANVTNLGPQDRTSLATQYARSDLLVLPSASEAFPLVVQEALACGTTVLIPQDILAGDPAASGVVMTAERSPGGFAAAINAFLCQRRELTSMEARQSRMNFATQRWPIQHCIDEWEKEFRALC